MKIKTITCHDVYNAGASLQAYALAKYLKDLGHAVEIIDYKPDYLRHYRLTGIANPKYNRPVLRELYNVLKFPGRLHAKMGKRKRSFDCFTEEYLPVTTRTYHSNEELKTKLPTADIYLAGSDQIWNPVFQNGKDPAFYLDFAPQNAVKASYAASFAVENIDNAWKSQIKDWLSNLDYISVRESSGVEIIHELGIDKVVHVADPVFLLDRKEWNKLAEPIYNRKPFIFLYDFDNNKQLGKSVRNLARKNGWKVYSYLRNPYCDRCFSQVGPREFLSLVRDAELVVSNSFHATAFSLIFEKPFWVLERKERINTRMRDLLKKIGKTERLMTPEGICNVRSMDYKDVNNKIKNQVEHSKKYLDIVLQGEKSCD